MAIYSLRLEADGWAVYDMATGLVLVLDGQAQAGLPMEIAAALAHRMSDLSGLEDALSPANDEA